MTYTPADPYTVAFPGSTTQKPDNIVDGQDILYQHVGPLWDEVVVTQNVLRGQTGAALILLTSGASATPLILKGASSQTADLLKVKSSAGTDILTVSSAGNASVFDGTGKTVLGSGVKVYGAAADAQPKASIGLDGALNFGDGGSSATDVSVYRQSSDFLRTGSRFLIGSYVFPNASPFSGTGVNINNSGAIDIAQTSAGSTNALTVAAGGESQYRFTLNSLGSMGWSSGSGAADITLARTASSVLTLTSDLVITAPTGPTGPALTVNGWVTGATGPAVVINGPTGATGPILINGKIPVYTDNTALTNSRNPTGPASGDLTGNYPNPVIAADVSLSGAPTTTTASTSDNSSKIATTAFVKNQGYATIASPSLTGTPLATTAAADTNTTQIATTAFVIGQASATTPVATGTAAVGSSTRFARADHVHAIGNDSVTLGTHTTGNYVATVAGTSNQIAVSGSGSESAAVTVSLASNIVTPGTYKSVTVDTYGRVITDAGTTNPTTLSGYGITDAQAKNDNLTGVSAVSGNGIYVRTGTNTATARTISTASTSRITVSNGDGVSGNPTLDLATVLPTGPTGPYTSVTLDQYGRVTSGSNPTPSKATNVADGLAGQILYQSAADTTSFLATGPAGAVLTSFGGATGPVWSSTISNANVVGPTETFASTAGLTGPVNFDAKTQSVVYASSNATANWTLNVRGNSTTTLNSMLTSGQSITIVLLCQNGSPAYYQTAMTIDGVSVTPKWILGTAPTSGSTNAIDAYTFTIMKTASATFTVLAGVNKFA